MPRGGEVLIQKVLLPEGGGSRRTEPNSAHAWSHPPPPPPVNRGKDIHGINITIATSLIIKMYENLNGPLS